MTDALKRIKERFGVRSLSDMWPELKEQLLKPVRRQPTGWPLFDKFMVPRGVEARGIICPSIVVLGAGPKAGKSIWSQKVCEHNVDMGGVSYYVDMENGPDRFNRRLLYRRAQINELIAEQAVKNGTYTEAEQFRIDQQELWFSKGAGANYLIADRPDSDRSKFQAEIEGIREEIGPSRPLFVVIDSMQKLPFDLFKDRRAGMDAWLRTIEETRTSANCVFVLISELKRPQKGEKAYRPAVTDFKESGDIEYTADISITMTKVGPPGRNLVRLEVLLGRDGKAGPVARYEIIEPSYNMIEMELEEIDKGE